MALRGLLGEGAPLSASSIGRLKAKWQIDYEEWKRQDISSLEVVYQWADGIYVKAGLEKDKAALLVIMESLPTAGSSSGLREWLSGEQGIMERSFEELEDARSNPGRLTIADGHLGIWSALGELHAQGKSNGAGTIR